MFERSHLETILKINGVSITASPEEIKDILLSASYNNQEIESAINMLKENATDNPVKFNDLQKVFLRDQALKPSEISALLGIEVKIGDVQITHAKSRDMTLFQTFSVIILSLIVAFSGIIVGMYIYEAGLFHPTVTAFGSSR